MSQEPDDKPEFSDLEPLGHPEEPQELHELEPLPEESDPRALPEETESIAERSSLPAGVPLPGAEPQPPAARGPSEGEESATAPEPAPHSVPEEEEPDVSEEIGAGMMPDLHVDQPHHPPEPRQNVPEVEPPIGETVEPPIAEEVGGASAAPSPAGGPPPTPESLPVQPAVPLTAGAADVAAPSAAQLRQGPIKPVLGQRRDLEQTPQVLRKAAKILLVGSLLPWSLALLAQTGETLPWSELYIAKAIALVAGWLFHQAVIANYGGSPSAVVKPLARAHKKIPMILAGIVAFVALAVASGDPNWEIKLRVLAEVATLLLAVATISHIHGYEHGARFNPLFPFMFVGPAVAGVVSVFFAMALVSRDAGLGVAALLGDLLLSAGGCLAIYSLVLAMKQAKIEGELKKQQAVEHRKALRAARRAQSDAAGQGSSPTPPPRG